MSELYRSATVVFGVWLLVWMRLSWPAVQDDAFIHLRYAVNLLHHHIISYNGIHSDYGTSSLLYVWLLAGLYEFFASPVLPRAVSSFFHLALFVFLVVAFARSLRSAPKLAWGFALLLLAVLVTPMAVRWLDDGMETSLALCLVSLVAFSVSRLCHSESISNRSGCWLFALGFVATLTRVEYLLLLCAASLTLFFARLSLPVMAIGRVSLSARLRLDERCAAPLAGSLVAASIIFFKMHALVPDTAVAKAIGLSGWLGTLEATASVFASSLSFGAFLLLFWLLTVVGVIVYKRGISFSILSVNSLFPITLASAAVRGQEVQGIRYFVWTLVFPIIWNTLELRWCRPESGRSVARILRIATYCLACTLLLLMPIESRLLYREFHARIASLAVMRAQHLERLGSMTLVAYDIGYIGYFTGSPVCDMAGLVNGRDRARLSSSQRVRICAAEHPQYAFLTPSSAGALNNSLDLEDWSICSVYALANLRSSDLHYLIASPAAVSEVCAVAGNSPVPLGPMLH